MSPERSKTSIWPRNRPLDFVGGLRYALQETWDARIDVGHWFADRPWGSLGEWFGGAATAAAIYVGFRAQRANHLREDDRLKQQHEREDKRIKLLEDRERDQKHREAVREFRADFEVEFQLGTMPDGLKTVIVSARTKGADPYVIRAMRLFGPNPMDQSGAPVPMPMNLVGFLVEVTVRPEWTMIASRDRFPPETTKDSFNYDIEVEDFNEFWIARNALRRYSALRFGRHYPGRLFDDRYKDDAPIAPGRQQP